MELPEWVKEVIEDFKPPFATGKLIIELELYKTGVTQVAIGGLVRVKPGRKDD